MVFQRLNTDDRGNDGSYFKKGKLSTSRRRRVIYEEDLPCACHQGPVRNDNKSKMVGGEERRLASTTGGEFTIEPFWGVVSRRGQYKSISRNCYLTRERASG
jgi:hypothetical protein